MAEPVREQAIVAVVALLRGMTGTRSWGTAYPNAPTVERRFREPSQVSQFPHLIVQRTSETRFDLAELDGAFSHALVLDLLGYVCADAAATEDTWLERLWHDVATTLQADRQLGTLAQDITLGEYETDAGELAPLAAFRQQITVTIFETMTVS